MYSMITSNCCIFKVNIINLVFKLLISIFLNVTLKYVHFIGTENFYNFL